LLFLHAFTFRRETIMASFSRSPTHPHTRATDPSGSANAGDEAKNESATNIVLRLVLEDDDVEHDAAPVRSHSPVLVSHVVVAEVAWVLTSHYRVARAALADALARLLEVEHVALESPPVVAAAIESFRGSKAGFSDCLILARKSA
jgi:predicted nucleic-acid-binding protein